MSQRIQDMVSYSSVYYGYNYQPVHQLNMKSNKTSNNQDKKLDSLSVTVQWINQHSINTNKRHIPSSFSTYPPSGSSAWNVTPPTTTEFSRYFGISILRSVQRPSSIFDGFKGLRQTLYPKLKFRKETSSKS